MKKKNFILFTLVLIICLGLLGFHSLRGDDIKKVQRQRVKLIKKPLAVLLPDLTVFIRKSPSTAVVGNKLRSVDVIVRNIGKGAKKSGPCFNVFLVLSTDKNIPLARPPMSGPFKEDRALGAGKGSCATFKPGGLYHIYDFGAVKENMPMKIPADTPVGNYYLGVVVDGEKWISESNEKNNTFYAPIKIIARKIRKPMVVDSQKPKPILLPDITPTSLYFDGGCNLRAKIKNIGKKKIKKNVDFTLFMNNQWIAGSGCALDLGPGGTTTILVSSKPLLGGWVEEIKEWKLVMDPDNKVFEEKEDNNSITVTTKCSLRKIRRVKKD